MARTLIVLGVALFAAGCAVQAAPGEFRPSRGLGSAWLMTVVGALGVLIPDLVARWVQWDDRSVVRIAAGALLFAGLVVLSDCCFDLDLVGSISG